MSLTNRAKKTLGREVNLGANTGDSVAGSAATRTWIFYLRSRLHPSTQKEHRLIALDLARIFQEQAPVTFNAFFADLDWEGAKVNGS